MHEVDKTDDDALFILSNVKDFIIQLKQAVIDHNEMEVKYPIEGRKLNILKWKDIYWQIMDGLVNTYTGDLIWGKGVECDTGTIIMFCRDTHLEEDYQSALKFMKRIETLRE